MKPSEEKPRQPEPGEEFTMPDGTDVIVKSSGENHVGIHVNGVYVWVRPEPPKRLTLDEIAALARDAD